MAAHPAVCLDVPRVVADPPDLRQTVGDGAGAARRGESLLVGGLGKACDRAMWQHAIRDEASRGWRLGAATAVCDGSKFYENVEHGLLLANARATGYPLRARRLSIAMCRVARRCSLAGDFRRAVPAERTIGAG